MHIVSNLIVPPVTSAAGEPMVMSEFIVGMQVFKLAFSSDLKDARLLLCTEESPSFYSYSNKGYNGYAISYGLGYARRWFLLKGSKVEHLDDDEFVRENEAAEYERYSVREIGLGAYIFVNKKTHEARELKNRRHRFITERNGFVYFRDNNIPGKVVKMNYDFEIKEIFEFDGQGPGSGKNIDNYLFYPIRGNPQFLEIFDIEKFEVVSQREEIKGSFLQVYRIDDIYHIFVGGELFLWDERILKKYPFEKAISGHSVKDKFIYIGFNQDSCVYAYKSVTLDCIGKKKVTLDGYHPCSFGKLGVHNVASFENDAIPYINRLRHMTAWKDEDFFSDEEWVVIPEPPIYTETTLADGENFSVGIHVDANHDYIKVIRHSMAIVEDAVSRHGVSIVPSQADLPYSEGFNGHVRVVFENAKSLKAAQRKQLSQGIKKIQSVYQTAYRGYAHGDAKPIQITVEYED